MIEIKNRRSRGAAAVKETKNIFTCDHCEKETASRYRAGWLTICVRTSPPDDDTECGGPMFDVRSRACAAELVKKETTA